MAALVTCKDEEDPIKNEAAIGQTTFSPFMISLWENSVAVETRVLIRSAQKPYAALPLPQ